MVNLANIRFKVFLNYLCEEEAKLNTKQVTSFIEQIDIKDPMMISLMELWISGIYEQNELIDTLFLI